MKKLILSVISISLLAFCNAGFAQGKIVVVNLNAAMFNTEVAQARIKELQATAEFADMRAKLESVEAELKKLGEDREKNGLTWDQAKLVEHQKKGENLVSDRKALVEKFQREENVLKQRIAQELSPKIQTALKEIIQVEGLGLILDSQVVIHAEGSYDITAKLTDRVNKMK